MTVSKPTPVFSLLGLLGSCLKVFFNDAAIKLDSASHPSITSGIDAFVSLLSMAIKAHPIVLLEPTKSPAFNFGHCNALLIRKIIEQKLGNL